MAHRNCKCVVCGKVYEAKRATSKYCSNACKQTAKRDNDAVWKRAFTVKTMIQEIDRSQSEEVTPALKMINDTFQFIRDTRSTSTSETIKALNEDARKAMMGLVMYANSGGAESVSAQKRLQGLLIEMLNHVPEKVQKDIFQQLRSLYVTL